MVVESDQAGGESQPGADGFSAASNRRELAETRCGFARLSRQEADAADARVAEARNAYGRQLSLIARLRAEVNPEAMRLAKVAAHREFRSAVTAAQARSDIESAATTWLTEINRINAAVLAERVRIEHERKEAARLDVELDRLTAAAEKSRAAAESAEAACREAQLGLGDAGATPVVVQTASGVPSGPEAAVPGAPTASGATTQDAPSAPPAVAASPETKVEYGLLRPPTIVRLLRRDLEAMNWLVAALAGDDAGERRRWQLLLSSFVDGLVAAAIDSGCLEFPPSNAFWSQFDREQAREVARGLASLGFRYDGISRFADDRVPDRRDLSMAVGQAGLFQVRIRHWPLPEETAGLMNNVRVDTDMLLAEEAPSFTMGELMRLLDWRSGQLADLWNEWPRLRPYLMAASPV
jgi:hypothetical protein